MSSDNESIVCDHELVETLHKAFELYLHEKDSINGGVVILSILTFAVAELSFAMHHHPNGIDECKELIRGAFNGLLDNAARQLSQLGESNEKS
ncbi:MAG: hypothetical protein V4568_18120 [Pseudomonadota bacterium]